MKLGSKSLRGYELTGHTVGRKRSSTNNTWTNMVQRCTNEARPDYKYYGGRGIKVCASWLNSFAAFVEDMGEKPAGKTLDRFPDNNGDYEKRNCRWATKDEQMQNTRATRLITFNGETHGLNEWARRIGINHTSLHNRIKNGWPLEKALTTGATR